MSRKNLLMSKTFQDLMPMVTGGDLIQLRIKIGGTIAPVSDATVYRRMQQSSEHHDATYILLCKVLKERMTKNLVDLEKIISDHPQTSN